MKNKKVLRVLTVVALLLFSAALVWQAHGLASESANIMRSGAVPAAAAISIQNPEPEMTAAPLLPAAMETITPTLTPQITVTISPTVTPAATPTVPSEGYKAYMAPLFDIPPPSPAGCEPPPHIPADSVSLEKQIGDLINAYRQENNLPPFNIMPHLTQAARRHARDMATNDYREHVGSDGSTPQERAEEACYELTGIGQIIGSNASAEAMMAAWSSSAGNRALMLTTEMVDMGLAYYYDPDSTYKHHWVVMFGRPASSGTIIRD